MSFKLSSTKQPPGKSIQLDSPKEVSWKEKKDNILAIVQAEKVTVKEVAHRLNMAVPTVYKYIRQLKKEKKLSEDFSFTPTFLKEEVEKNILTLLMNKKQSAQGVADELGISLSTVYKYVNLFKKNEKIPQNFSFITPSKDIDQPLKHASYMSRAEAESKILFLIESKKQNAKEVAAELGVSATSIYKYVSSLKAQGKLPQDFSFKRSVSKELLKAKVYSLAIHEKRTLQEIAAELDITERTVHNYIHELKEEGQLPRDFLFRLPLSKKDLKKQIYMSIVKKQGEVPYIARKLHISVSTVYKYIYELKEEQRIPQGFSFFKPSPEELKEAIYVLAVEEKKEAREITRELEISNTTVSRHIQALKDSGRLPEDFTFKRGRPNKK